MIILDGKTLQKELSLNQKERFQRLGKKCLLVIVSVGENQESEIYIRHKIKYGEDLGVLVKRLEFSENISFDDLKSEINKLNNDEGVSGIIIQLPAGDFKAEKLIVLIDPKKDVDGFNKNCFVRPATARGVEELLSFYKIGIKSKKAIVVGKSLVVGKPIAEFLRNFGANVKVFDRESINIKEEAKNSEILVFATGAVKFFNCDYIGDNLPVVIDVGISKGEDGKVCGDTDFRLCLDKVSAMTPVPGGVGPMTVWALFENLYELAVES